MSALSAKMAAEGLDASVDKTVMDRRSGHRATGSRLALQEARQDMQSDNHQPSRYRDELLQLHAARLVAARWALIALSGGLAVALAPLLNWPGQVILGLWLVLMLAIIMVGDRFASGLLEGKFETRTRARWAQRFGAVQIGHGFAWAGLILLGHPIFTADWTTTFLGGPGLPAPFLLGILLIVGATHLTVSHTQTGGVGWVCLPPTIALLALSTLPAASGDAGAAASLVAAATLAITTSMLGTRLMGYARANVQARVEKDHAVMEAEEARNISEEARRRAEEANLAKTRFLATMSHELRTPLNAILGFSELMESEALGPLGNTKYKEYAGDVHASGSHLLKLINEILDLSRVEAGRYELNEEPVDLVAIATEAMQMVKLKANAKSLAVQIRAERDLPRVWADERAVRQVVLNLLSNAVKFTPKSGRVSVKVGWTGSGGQYVTVVDTGPGIAEEEIPIVLSAFGQGSVALRVAEPGSGLGLPIVQAFMKIHDGRLDLQSRLREGTSVTALFPRKRVMTGEIAERSAA